MAIIYTYPKLINLQNQDLLLISDTSSKRKDTMRVELGDLANFIITSTSAITGGGTENYVPIFGVTGNEISDSQLQQSPQLGSGLYQMKFRNADRFIIDKPSSVTSGDPEYLIQQDGQYKVSFGWDDDGGGFGFIYNWAGNGLRLGAAGQNPQFELNTVVPKIISHTDHEFEGAILDVNGLSGTAGQVLSSTGSGVQWTSDGGGTVTGTGTTNTLPLWTDGPNGVLGDSNIAQQATEILVDDDFEITGSATFPDAVNINNATTNSAGIIFNHPAGGASGIVNMYYNGATAGSRFVISRAATGGAEIELQSNGDINLNRLGNGNLLVGGEVTFDDYGSGAITGTATRSLAVDVNGKVIEQPVPVNTILINGLVNNLASAGSGGYDFMEFVSNVTGPTQIPVMKLPRNMRLVGFTFVWMGDTALSIGAGEQVEFTIGTIPSGSNPIIGNYTSADTLFTIDSSYNGTWADGDDSGLTVDFNAGDIIAVVGQETGTVTPNTGELGITLEFVTL